LNWPGTIARQAALAGIYVPAAATELLAYKRGAPYGCAMAFVCTAVRQKYHFDAFRDEERLAITVPVGYDDESDRNYFMVVGLDVTPPGVLEIYFHLLEVNGETKGEQIYWSGKDVIFISKADRALILSLVLDAITAILNAVKPPNVFILPIRLAQGRGPIPGRRLRSAVL
jgi:hypothetical protein